MKKRTLVCFLIFILCVFHSTIIPNTVFGQETATPAELAQDVYDDFSETLVRADLQDLTVQVLAALTDPATLQNPLLVAIGFDTALNLVLADPSQIKQVVPDEDDVIEGLIRDDADVRTFLMNPEARVLMQSTEAAKELLRLLYSNETWAASLSAINLEIIQDVLELDDTPKPDPPDPAPPTISITTPSPTPDQSGSFNVAFATADVNGDAVTVTGSISVVPAEAESYYSIPSGDLTSPVRITQAAPTTAMPTIPGATVTLTLIAKNDGTADSSPSTFVVKFATAQKPTDPIDPPDKPEPPTDGELPPDELIPSNLNGESRLGGLSVNKIHGRAFIRKLIETAFGFDAATADTLVEPAVEGLIALIPIENILPEDQIRYNLISQEPFSIFADEPVNERGVSVLDFENFGNAITPTLSEALYAHEDTPNTSKFSTRDNLNVYVRVPRAFEDGIKRVDFWLDGKKKEGQRIAPEIFQSDTIPYTFRLEETLAATNLPAWPDLGNQIFSKVELRYSQEGLDTDKISLSMMPRQTDKGVVWEADVGIIPGRSVYYYFEVTLVEPVKLEIVNRDALAEALFSPDGKTSYPASREYTIKSWSMPDPRNLQLQERGIFKALFDDDVRQEITNLLPLLTDGSTDLNIQGPEFRKLQNLLLRNVNELTNNFESNFDPMFDSVFTVPKIDYEKQSLWYVKYDEIEDGKHSENDALVAVVYNADDEPIDKIVVEFETDTSAPEATIDIGPANANTTGYWNKDGVFVATAPVEGAASLLNIASTTDPGEVGVDDGFLIYQIIELDKDGNPEGTWLPLTVEASLLSSDIWDLVKERFPSSLDDSFKVSVPGTDIQIDIRDFALRSLLGFLESGVPGIIEAQDLQALVADQLRGLLGIELNNEQYTLLRNLLGAIVDDIDLIPFTYDPERTYKFAIQGDQLPLLVGDYGIRAMGIDPLLNIGSHVAPTHLRIVPHQYDRTSVTKAALGDINHNEKEDAYESNVIYRNARDVTLTITIDERSDHPLESGPQHPNASIFVYYKDAGDVWQPIGTIGVAEGEGAVDETRTIDWKVSETVFDGLLDGLDAVEVRTVTTNALQHPIDINVVDLKNLTEDQDLRISDAFIINLVDDVHPVDPVVLVVDVDPDSIKMTNQDSGAPQGTIMLEAYTPRVTVPATDSIRIEVMRPGGETPIKIGEVALDDPAGMDGGTTGKIMFKGKTLAEVYTADELHTDDTDKLHKLHIDATSSYLKWIITVDTTLLDDTITKDSPAARGDMPDENRYMVRAYAVDANGEDISPVLMGDDYTQQFSVDNDDDVAPLGPTNVVISKKEDVNAIDSVFTDNGDGTYTVGGLVDKYDPNVPSPVVTLTLTPKAERHTYKGVKLHTTLPPGAIIGKVTETEPETETAPGSGVFTVTIDVGTLMDDDEEVYNDKYLQNHAKDPYDLMYNPTDADVYSFQVHALTYDDAEPYDDATAADEMFLEYGNIQADDHEGDEITINVENTYRPDPGVIAITVDNTENTTFNPDSGAPQGELAFNVYTYYITSAPTEGIRVEVQRPNDPTRERITGTAVDPVEVDISEIQGIADFDDIAGGLVGITQAGTESGGESVVAIPRRYMKWQFIVDTRELALEDTFTEEDEPINRLEDTISRGDDSQRDVELDENQYKVYAISLTPKNKAHTEYAQRDGVEASFSLDNVDDVPPLGPTNITDVADHVGSLVANEEDGSYTARGIVDDDVESTKLTFTIKPAPTVKPITYEGGKIRLVQTNPDGTVEELPPVDVAEEKITVDIGKLDNGMYKYYALVADRELDEDGNNKNWQDHENEIASPIIEVHVLNFRVSDIMELMVTSVDDVPVEGELPDPIPLRDSIAVSFNVNNNTLFVEDLTGVVVGGQFRDGDDYTAGSDGANAFSLSANNLMELPSQHTTPHGRVQIRERYVDFPLANINLDNTAPVITFVTPTEGATVNNLPTLHAEYNDGDLGVGISADNTAVVSLDRLRPEDVVQDEVSIDVDADMVEQDMDSVVYTRIDKLAGGAYQFTVMVSDSLGNVGEASVNFAVEGIDPTVVITAPASGQTLDESPEKITGFFAGGGEVNISKFTVGGVEVDISDESEVLEVDGNNFTYTPPKPLAQGDHEVEIEVTDGSDLTALTALTFIVNTPGPTVAIHAVEMYDISKPTIKGEFSGDADPVSLSLTLDGNEVLKIEGETSFEFQPENPLDDGEYTLVAVVKDANGKTAKATSVFAIRLPVPTVSISSPVAGGTYDHTFRHISGEVTGYDVKADDVTVMVNAGTDNAMELDATLVGNQFSANLSAKLPEAPDHKVTVTIKDANGKTAEASATFSVVYPDASVSISSPVAGDTYDHTFRHISGEFTGVDVAEKGSVTVMVNAGTDNAMELDATLVDNQFSANLSDKLPQAPAHKVTVTVKDANGESAEASATFSVVYPDASVSISSPVAGDTYDHTFRHISGEFTGVDVKEEDVTVMVNAGTDNAMELDVTLADNQFSANLSAKLPEAPNHKVTVTIKDANGETAEASATFSVVYPDPSVTLQSPVAGHTYTNGSPIFNGEFTGVGADDGNVDVTVTVDGDNIDAMTVDVTEDGNQFSGTLDNPLPHGTYTVTAKVVDENEKSAMTSVDFIVDISGPTLAILSPAAGQTYHQGRPTIRAEFSGMTETKVTKFMLGGNDVEVSEDMVVELNEDSEDTVKDYLLTYTPADDLATDEYTVMVEVTDENGKTAQATVVFNIKLDTTPPVISEVAPSGTIKDSWVNISAVITDEQSDILSVEFYIRDEDDVNKAFVPFVSSYNPGPANHRITADKIKNGQIEISDSFGPGTHTMQVIAESLGGTTVHTWSFTVVIDNIAPIITSITPSGTIHRGLPTISASANDASGVAKIAIIVRDDNGEIVARFPEVEGEEPPTNVNDAEEDVTGITRQDFIPKKPLDEGTYDIEVRATDTHGNSSTARGVFTVDFDTAAPIITSSSPQGGARLTYKQTFNKQTGNDDKENGRPTISLTYGDAETGVNVDSIKLVIEAPKKGGGRLVAPIDLTDDQKSATQVLYTLSSPVFPDDQNLEPGEYMVKLEVSDNASQQGNVPEDNEGARKANTAVYQFSFFVEYSDAPILAVKPYNHPNPFKDNTRISFTLNRESTVSIVIYDVTLRPVRVLKDNEVMPAGNYIGRHGTQWDGKTSSGENLARGIYFCEIVVTDGIEPEYAILKLALTR